MGTMTEWRRYGVPETVTTYVQDPNHPWARVIESFVTTPDGVRVFTCAVARDPTRRPRFRGLTMPAVIP